MEATATRTSFVILAGLSLCTAGVYAAYRHAPLAVPLRTPTVAATPHQPDPEPAPPLAAAASTLGKGEVKMSARLDRTAVLSGSDGVARVELTLEAGAEDGEAKQAHQPTDLLVVL
ncbi:MAG TPA: hypothetical protein VMF89_10255, partial [Polyangiales bacterium]|nr:hypothetical protein [Polyangiales bacterium]